MTRQVVSVPSIAAPQAHYSHGVLGNGQWLFVAGQIPIAADGELVAPDAAAQAEQVLDNLRAVVEAAGGTLDDVVKTTVYIVDHDDRAAVGAARRKYFGDPPPANALVVVKGLADPRFLVEIEAIALIHADD